MARHIRRHRGGFTLVEALAAGTILAVFAGVIGTSVSQSLGSLTRARDYQRAAGLLDRVLTKVDMIGPSRVMSEGPLRGRFAAPDDRFNWELEIDTGIDGHLYEVTARVLWNGGKGSAEIETLINDPPKTRNPVLVWDDL